VRVNVDNAGKAERDGGVRVNVDNARLWALGRSLCTIPVSLLAESSCSTFINF